MRLAALMCVGAGEAQRHLARALKSARDWADLLIIYGDGPDPTTHAMLEHAGAHHCRITSESMYEQGEHLVRNAAFGLADETLDPGDLVLVLDADEVVAGTRDEIRGALTPLAESGYRSWCVHFRHLWSPDGSVHRVDGMWQPSIGPRLYRHQHGLRVAPVTPNSWVCSTTPAPPPVCAVPVLTIDHWGYARPQDRPRKHQIYSQRRGHHPNHIASILNPDPTLETIT